MGIVVLVLGSSGSGKSTSLRNFDENEIEILNVAGKPLPFRKKLKTMSNPSYDNIRATLKANRVKTYAIDDSQYLMAFESFDHAKETGYGKFTNMALNFKNLIDNAMKLTSPDTIVYFLHHTELSDDGKVKAKTLGKMLDNQLTVEGLFLSCFFVTSRVLNTILSQILTEAIRLSRRWRCLSRKFRTI